MSRPQISVLTPVLEQVRFVADAIDSVTEQQDGAMEHVVQDGDSRDGTRAILERADPMLNWRSEADAGQSDALNRALRRSRGEWVGWLNADEFYLPHGPRFLTEAAVRLDADVVFGDAIFVDETGKLVRLVPQHRFFGWLLRGYGPFLASCATFFRRDVLGDDPFDVRLRRVMDWALYLRLHSDGCRFVHVAQPVAAFRLHPDQVTALPHSEFSAEYHALAEQYGVLGHMARSLGRGVHGVLKLVDGAYHRQWAARSLRGVDLRWFRCEVGRSGVELLHSRCYERDLPATVDEE